MDMKIPLDEGTASVHGPGRRGPVAARFDDRRGAPAPLELRDPYRILAARRVRDVPDVLREAERESASGGWAAGFVTYEAAPAFDRALTVRAPRPDLPVAWFAAFRSATPAPAVRGGGYRMDRWRPETSEERYQADIAAIQGLIRSGDTYQTNYTLRLRGRVQGDLRSVYTDLLDAQRGGYHAYLATGDHAVVSASPELFFRWDGRRIENRPMKGTIARGRWEAEDRRRRADLLASGKDRAENVMIVDLLRNDLGKVARFGSVQVDRLFEIERFETVWQMTSTVTAETRPGVTLVDVFAAMFPCGSVTGAPKARTMQIIKSLETSPRGIYCGAIGLLAPPGSGRPRAEFSVAIRTLVIDERDRSAEYGVGGGVVHESTAAEEYAEAMVKANVLRRRRSPLTLLETMRWEPGTGVWLLDRHLDRLSSSARYLGIDLRRGEIGALLAGIDGSGPQRVRLLVPESGRPDLEVTPLVERPPTVVLAIDDRPIDSSDFLRYHKNTRREPYEQAAARHPEADDVVLVNERGEIVETTIANLAVLIGDDWFTPPLDAGCLPGVYREELIARDALVERSLTISDLVGADGLAVINSVAGWRAGELLEQTAIGAEAMLTQSDFSGRNLPGASDR